MSDTQTPVPTIRPRRLRSSAALRSMVRETHLTPADFIYPLFVTHGEGVRHPIPSMPGIFQLSIDQLAREAQETTALGIPSVVLFGLPAHKDPVGLENFAPDGIVQQAIRELKTAVPDLIVITDVCLCEYTDHGHCGLLNTHDHHPHLEAGYVLNDETLDILVKVAISHAAAGADIVAPSGMFLKSSIHTSRVISTEPGIISHVNLYSGITSSAVTWPDLSAS